MTDYLELAKSIVEQASSDGVEIEVVITDNKETSIQVNKGAVEKLSQSGSRGIGVRAIQNGKQGYAYTSDFSDESITETWQTAVTLSKVATEDEFRKLPEPEPISDEDLEIYDPAFDEVPVEDKVAVALKLEESALAYDEHVFMTQRASYGDQVQHMYLANSKGFAGEYSNSGAFAFLMALAKDDNGMVAGMHFGVSTKFEDLDPVSIGEGSAKKAVSMLSGEPVPTQKTTVVLDHFVGAQILAALSQALSASNWQRSRSFLMGKMGQEVGSSMVTLMDNGRLKGGFASAPFDGEGVPTKATRLIDEGVLQNLTYDSYTAAKEGTVSTGNAGRNGHQSLPGLAPTNFYMQAGEKTPEEIIKGVDNGFYVMRVMTTGGIDPVTGECSMSAEGVWIENGELTKSVGGVAIATTLSDFLMNVSDVGNDLMQVPFFGSIGVPTLRVDNVTVSGT